MHNNRNFFITSKNWKRSVSMQNCRNTSKNVFLKAHLTSLSGQVFSCSTSSVIFISILQSLRYISKLEWWYNEKYLCFQIRKNPKIKPILHNTKSLFKIATEFITSNYWNRSVSGRIVETLLILFSWKSSEKPGDDLLG